MGQNSFELDERDLNISLSGNEEEFEENANKFIDGYISTLNRSGNTLYYTTKNIFPLVKRNCLWGEGLYLFIDLIEAMGKSLPVGRILNDIFLTNLHNDEDEEFITLSTNKGLKILEGLSITGQDYLVYKLVHMGHAKVVYNSLIKFLLAFKEYKKKDEERYYLKEDDGANDYHDEDLFYWLDVADGEATSDVPPSERRLHELSFWDLDEFKPLYESEKSVINILTRHINIILEANSISFKNKMILTDLYQQCIYGNSMNSSLIYGQLRLILDQMNISFANMNLNLDYIDENINNFYNAHDMVTFEVCKFKSSKEHSSTFVVFANFENGFFKSVYLKQVNNSNLLFSAAKQFENGNIHKFIDMFVQDIISKHHISEIQAYVDDKKNQTENIENHNIEEVHKKDTKQKEMNIDPFIIDDDDLPW